MAKDSPKIRRAEAALEFNRHEQSTAGARIAASLDVGMVVIRDLMYNRIYFDIEQLMGRDSMLMPISEPKSQHATKAEIDLFQIASTMHLVRDKGYTRTKDRWFADWLARLRLGDTVPRERVEAKLNAYGDMDFDQRRLTFVDTLLEVMPESRRAPLVLFQLLPLSAQIVTAQAFQDSTTAADIRRRQMALLPAIHDCILCQGAVLENDDMCTECGNPVWELEWLSRDD